MLVLSRKIGERIIIDGGIEVMIQKISGDRVTIGLVAPANVKILRSELVVDEQKRPSTAEPKARVEMKKQNKSDVPVAVPDRHRDHPRFTATGLYHKFPTVPKPTILDK